MKFCGNDTSKLNETYHHWDKYKQFEAQQTWLGWYNDQEILMRLIYCNKEMFLLVNFLFVVGSNGYSVTFRG